MRVLWVGIGLLSAAVVLGVPGVSAQSAGGYHWFYEQWSETGPFTWANLTWSGSSGGIVWDGTASSDNQPTDPHTYEEYNQAQKVRANTPLETGFPPRSFTFTSAPVPKMMVLNVSRNIQVELFLTFQDGTGGKTCNWYNYEPPADITLTMDGKILAGTTAMAANTGSANNGYLYHYIQWYYVNKATAPTDPAGYTTCRYALGAEAAIIPEGAVLKVNIDFLGQVRPYSFGLAGDHRSVIKFPMYPPEEIFFRYPELAPPEPTDGEGDGSGAGSRRFEGDAPASLPATPVERLPGVLPLAGLGLVAGVATPAMRGRRGVAVAAVALLFASSVLAGCLSGMGGAKDEDEDLKGRVSNSLIRDGLNLTSGVFGSMLGQVFDDLHVPVQGVHVSIIGLANFTETDGKGRFKFLNLLPGVYKLRFDKKEYRSFEGEVEVQAGFVSRPEIMMYLINLKDRDARPHNHDYWPDGATTKTIMETNLGTSCTESEGCLVSNDFQIVQKADEFNSIFPGTAEVEVTLTWDAGLLGQEKLGLSVQGNDPLRNHTVYAPRASGVPFHIAVTWEKTDPGHQPVSSWLFKWYESRPHYRYDYYACAVLYCIEEPEAPSLTTPPDPWVKAKVVIKRGGALPLEPGHPDRWGGKDVLQVVKSQGISVSVGGTLPSDTGLPEQTCWYVGCTYAYIWPIWPSIVPPDTKWVEITLKLNRAPDPAFGVSMFLKTANIPASTDYYSVTGWKEAAAVSGTWEKWTYKVPIKEAEADYMYAKAGNWRMSLRADNPENQRQDAENHQRCVVVMCGVPGVVEYAPMTYTVDMVAHRDALP